MDQANEVKLNAKQIAAWYRLQAALAKKQSNDELKEQLRRSKCSS